MMFHPPLLTVDPAVTPSVLREMARGPRDLGYACVKTAGLATTSYGLQGMFYVSASGWGLLNVPNSLVRGAFDALHEPGAQLPPSKGKVLNGHISVLTADEVRKLGGPNRVAERGHFYRYTLGPLKCVEPAGWPEMSKVWFVECRSPELEKLRKSYGLRPLPNGHPFHITVAVRKKNVLRDNDVSKAAEAVPVPSATKHAGTSIPRAIQSAVDALSEKDWDGILLLYHPGPPARAHLDVMDWGDGKVGDRLEAVLKKELGGDLVERVNEGGKPTGEGWVSVHPAWSKHGAAEATAYFPEKRADRPVQAGHTGPLYHASSVGGVARLDPRPSHVLGGESAVFATPDRDLAVSFLAPWRDIDFEQGYVGGQPYMKEMYPGAFEKIYKGKKGTLYHLPADEFDADPRLMREERIRRTPVAPVNAEEFPDALEALRSTRFALVPHGQKSPWDLEREKAAAFFPEKRAGVKQRVRVLMPDADGHYLFQRSVADPRYYRVPGGGVEEGEDVHRAVLREIEEEFGKKVTPEDLTYLGPDYRPGYAHEHYFHWPRHGLAPGKYQASNDPGEVVDLVRALPSGPHYWGPEPHRLWPGEKQSSSLPPGVVIDRPKGYRKVFQTAGGPKEQVYPLDYGYLKGVVNPQDNEEADVFVGSGGPRHGRFMKGKPGPAGWVPDEYKWYSGLTDEEFRALHDWWHGEHDKGVTWDWQTLPHHQAVVRDAAALAKQAAHLAHVGGVSGSGKTTLLEDLARKHPGLVAKDIDDFDEQAKRELKVRWTPGRRWNDEELTGITRRKQDLLDRFLRENEGRPVVTGGIHFEEGPSHVLKLPESRRLMLDTWPARGSWRAYLRSRRDSPDNPYSLREGFGHWLDNRKTYRDFLGMGFQPGSPEEVRRKIETALAKQAAHHAPVVELRRRDGRTERICPHCGKSIKDGEVYTDAKGWTFHRPCFQRGKGSVKLAADPLEEYLAPFDPDEFELPGESLEKEAIDAETVARAWARVQRYGRASRAAVLQHRAREAQRAAQAAHAAGDLALARRHGGMAEVLNRRAGAAGVREGGLPYAESFAGRLGPSYDSAGAEMRQGWAAGHNQRSLDRLHAMNAGTMDWTPGEGFHRPDTPVDTRLPANFYRPVTAPDPNSYAARLLTKEAPVITGEMKPAVRDRIMSAMGAPGRAEAVYRGTGRAHALVDRGVAVAPEDVYTTLHEMGHLATPPGVEEEMRRLWDTHGKKTPLVRDLAEPVANRAYLNNYDALKKELGGSLPAREKLEAWAHNQEQTYSSLALHRGLAERARAGAGGALAPDRAARLPDWVRGAVDYQGPVQSVGNYSSSWRPAAPGAAGVATPATPVTTRAPKVVSVPPPPKTTGVKPTPPVSPGNPVMAVSDPAPRVKDDPSYRRMAARALATGVGAAGAGLGYYGTTGTVSKGAAAPEQKPGSLQGQGGSLPDRRPAIMNRALADTEVGHAGPSRPQSHRPAPADPQGQVRVEPRPAGPEGPEVQRPPAGPGPAPAEGRPA